MRICLIGLPRSGSQYIVELITTSFNALNPSSEMQDCKEPFSFAHDFKPWLRPFNNNGVIDMSERNFLDIKDQVFHILGAIDSANKTQPLTMRLFFYNYNNPYMSYIISVLKKNNFKFLVAKRKSIDNHLLSYAIANTSDKWNSHEHKPYTNEKFKVTNFGNIEWLYQQITQFDNKINQLNIDYDTIIYENAISDLEKALNIPITNSNLTLKKQVVGNPYNLIENSHEVKIFISKLKNGTQIY